MSDKTFGTAINCMDGRTQSPVAEWLKSNYHIDFVDTITEPGANKAVATGPEWQVTSVKDRVAISVNKHGSKVVAIVGHHDCAGYPMPKPEQLETTRRAMRVVAAWHPEIEVIGLWVSEKWQVEVVTLNPG